MSCNSLAELIAKCDLSAPPPEDMRVWELMNTVGKETQLSEGCDGQYKNHGSDVIRCSDLKNAFRRGLSVSSRFKRGQAMRIGTQMGYSGVLLCAFARGFRKGFL